MTVATDLAWLGVAEAGRLLRAGDIGAVELTEATLAWIDRTEPFVHTFVALDVDGARAAARVAEAELAAGLDRGSLHGIPYSVKDLVAVAGLPLRAGSRAVDGTVPAIDAAVISSLREAGAICLGKVATHEFAWGMHSDPARNPWDGERLSGGSSGGSGSAVAAGQGAFSIGTDCGCSVRAPAALNGVCAIRPTHGRVAMDGVVPLSMTMDNVGPLARSAEDVALILDAIADGWTWEPPQTDDLVGLRLGVPRGYFFEAIQPGVAAAVEAAIDVLRGLGAEVVDVELERAAQAAPVDVAIVNSESAVLLEDLAADRGGDLGDDVRAQLALGRAISARDYLRGQQLRTLIGEDFARVFGDVDAIVTPTVPAVAQRHNGSLFIDVEFPGGTTEDVGWTYCRYTFPMSVAGVPTVAVPCGLSEGLPAGISIAARQFGEATALRVALAYQRVTDHHRQRPPALMEATA